MTFVPHSRILPRTLWRPAIFLFAVAQIFLSFAPLLEEKQGPDARAHVEELGTTLHHAHNDADCAACTARHLLAASQLGHSSGLVFGDEVAQNTTFESSVVGVSRTRQNHPRAPPALA